MGAAAFSLLGASGFMFGVHMLALSRVRLTGPVLFVTLMQASIFSSAILVVFGTK